jgi:hypothetical protein
MLAILTAYLVWQRSVACMRRRPCHRCRMQARHASESRLAQLFSPASRVIACRPVVAKQLMKACVQCQHRGVMAIPPSTAAGHLWRTQAHWLALAAVRILSRFGILGISGRVTEGLKPISKTNAQ